MIKMNQVKCIERDERVSSLFLQTNYKRYSWIPVFKGSKNNIIGVILMKTLIGIDFTENKTIKELYSSGEIVLWKPLFVSPTKTIESLWIDFIQGRGHMAIVTSDVESYKKFFDWKSRRESFVLTSEEAKDIESLDEDEDVKASWSMSIVGLRVLGIVTLEDVLECMLNRQILDEQDHDQLLILQDPIIKAH